MDEPDEVEKARRQWKVRVALVAFGLVAILALSWWIRTGHNSLLADYAVVALVAAGGFFTWKTNDARAAQDPAFAKGYKPVAKAQRPVRFLGNANSLVLLAFQLMVPINLGLANTIRHFPPLKHLLMGITFNQILGLSFAISLSIVGGIFLLARRFLSRPRPSEQELSDTSERD